MGNLPIFNQVQKPGKIPAVILLKFFIYSFPFLPVALWLFQCKQMNFPAATYKEKSNYEYPGTTAHIIICPSAYF